MRVWPLKQAVTIMLIALCSGAAVVTAQQKTANVQTPKATVSRPDTLETLPDVVRVFPARNFGYVIGDVLTQHITPPGSFSEADLSELSDISRVSTWLQRQAAFIETLDNQDRILTIHYQIINSPLSIINVALPELTLAAASEKPMMVPAWPFTLGPLTLNAAQSDPGDLESNTPAVEGVPLKANMTLPHLDEGTSRARLRLALLILSLTLASWAAWYLWRNQRDKVRLPFARALRTLDSHKQNKSGNIDTSWKELHHAFNQSAGTVVSSASVDTLLNSHDWLRPLEPRIRSFYAASAARHYALPACNEPYDVVALARALADCERRSSR